MKTQTQWKERLQEEEITVTSQGSQGGERTQG